MTDPATAAEALALLERGAGLQQSVLAFLAAQDAAVLPAQAVADQLRALERHDAIQAAVRGRLLVVFDARDGHLAGGQRSTRAWLVHSLRVARSKAPTGRSSAATAPHPARANHPRPQACIVTSSVSRCSGIISPVTVTP
jgi:hypothetical protein